MNLTRRRSLGALVVGGLTALSTLAGAQTSASNAQRIAVVSLLGDDLHVVTGNRKTGSHLDTNPREAWTMPAGLMDSTSLMAVEKAGKKAAPGSEFLLLKLPSARLLGDPLGQPEGARYEIPAALLPTLKQIQATQLLLVAPVRSELRVQGEDFGAGGGVLTGLGYYVDDVRMVRVVNGKVRGEVNAETRASDAGTVVRGYLAPYVYLKASLIDVQSGAVLAQKVVTRAIAMSGDRVEGAADPFETMDGPTKIKVLTDLLGKEVDQATTSLLAAR